MGFLLITVGFLLVFLAVLLSGLGLGKTRPKTTGGVVLLGPFPIVFGSDTKTVKTLIYLTLILMLVALVFTVMPVLLRGG